MKRSAIAFARGARIGVRMTRMSAPMKTASNAAVNLLVRADQEPELVGVFAEVHEQVAGLLGDPRPRGMGGDSSDMYAATAVFDHDEDVEAALEHGCRRGRNRWRGSRGPARTGTVARSGRTVEARGRGRANSFA